MSSIQQELKTEEASTSSTSAISAAASAAAAGPLSPNHYVPKDSSHLRALDRSLPTICVDVDEVLGQFVTQLCLFHNESYGTNLTLADFHDYDFVQVRKTGRLLLLPDCVPAKKPDSPLCLCIFVDKFRSLANLSLPQVWGGTQQDERRKVNTTHLSRTDCITTHAAHSVRNHIISADPRVSRVQVLQRPANHPGGV